MRIIRLTSTESTNLDARRLAEGADFGPLWVLAETQTGGRGRRGRNWVSPKGNFYGSFLFPTDKTQVQRSLYSFVMALGIYEALKEVHMAGDFNLKWPNDILLGEAKISGMLLETGLTHQQAWVIAGIGVNLVSSPINTPYPATHLGAYQDDVPQPDEFLNHLSERISHWKSVFETSGFAPIRDAWLERAANIPGPVTVRLPDETFEGRAIDLNHDGALQVQLANGTKRQVHAGDVFPG